MRKNLLWTSFSVVAFSLSLMTNAFAFFGSPGNQVPVQLGKNGNAMGYYEYLPTNYEEKSGKKFPLVINLHGIGEIGNGTTQLSKLASKGTGLPPLLAAGKDLPAIVLSPQSLVDPWQASAIDAFLTYAIKTYKVDADRVYIIGLSLGGGGTWNYGLVGSNKIAAMLPICGGSWFYSYAKNIPFANMPIWASHAVNDSVLSYRVTVNNFNKINPEAPDVMTAYQSGKDGTMLYSKSAKKYMTVLSGTTTINTADTRQRLTLFKDGDHFIWNRVYQDPNVWTWLFSWKRGGVFAPNGVVTPTTPPVVTPPAPTTPTTPPVVTNPKPTTPVPVISRINIDFGIGGSNTAWNNGAGKTGAVVALKNDKGVASGISMAVLSNLGRTDSNGTKSAPAALGMPAFATQDITWGQHVAWSGFSAQPALIYEFRNLTPGKKYDFQFFASRLGVTNGDILATRYNLYANGKRYYTVLNAANNSSKVAKVDDVVVGNDGKVRLEVVKDDGNKSVAGFFMISNLQISY